jgi:tetratricopeptide (TPR) repeat protein
MHHRGYWGNFRAVPAALVLAAVAALPLPAGAQDPWEKTPLEAPGKELLDAAKAIKAEEGTSLLTLFSEMRWTFQADGTGECRFRTVYRVVSEEGLEGASVVRADWSPWYQARPVIRARVTTSDGKSHVLNPATLSERPIASNDPEIFSDRRSLTGPLPAVAVGSVVEIEIVTSRTKPFFDRGMTHYHYFGADPSVHRERLVLDSPESFSLGIVARKLADVSPREETAGGRKIVTYEVGPWPAAKPVESFTPGDVPLQPYVAFSTGSSWNEVAKGYHEIVEAQIASADLELLGELPSSDLPPEERLAGILARLQARVRYTSLAFGDASIIPRPPAECLKRGYGDCKDKSALLVAALRKVGLEAHVALLFSGNGPDVEPDLPGLGVFDHAIVHLDAPDLWIDPTDRFAKPRTLPLSDCGRRALIAAPGSKTLVLIPPAVPGDHVELKERDVFLSEFGPGRIVETIRPRGEPERRYRESLDQDRKTVTKHFESYASQVFFAKKLVSCTYAAATDLTKPLEIHLEAAEAGRAETDLREAVVGISLDTLWNTLPYFLREPKPTGKPPKEAPPPRVNDIVLFQPYVQELRYRIVPPPGFKPRPLPKSETIAFGPAKYSKEFALKEDGSVAAVFRFDCVKSRYSAEEGKELRAAYLKHRGDGIATVKFFQVGQAHLEGGRIREALKEFRDLAADHPKTALYRGQIATALLAGGLGDAARHEARKATSLDPDSRVSHEILGWVMQHDLLGRRFERGWDPKASEAAYRRALEIEPDNLNVHLNLAIMLEVDVDGSRYGSLPRLEEAIKVYESVSKEIAGTAFDNNLSIAMMWAGRFADLLGRTTAPTPTNRVLSLVARAAQDGPEAALTYAAQNIADDSTRQASLSEAGEILVKMRRYPEASALLTAAARGSADAANLLGRAERLSRVRRWEDAPREGKDPASVVKRALALLMASTLDLEALKPLFSRHALSGVTVEDQEKEFRSMHSGILANLKKKMGVPIPVIRDLTLSLVEPVVEGEEATGYRVRIPPTFGNAGPQLWYLHPEQSSLRLLGPGAPDVGRLALSALEAGEEEKARTWLDWAADEMPAPGTRDNVESDPFTVLWKKGKAGDARTLRRAAASLAVRGPRCAAAIKILEEARREEGIDKTRSFILNRALATGYLSEGRAEEASSASLRLLEAEPESELAYYVRRQALIKLNRYDDFVALIEDQLRRKPNDVALLHDLQHTEMKRGKMEASQAVGRKLIKLGQADAWVYNNLAWSALIAGVATEATLKDAQQSVMASRSQSDACLHTLATAYADLARPAEARDVLLQAIRLRTDPEPQPQDWYVLGRIAEEYGAIEAAREAYQRTELDHDTDSPCSTNRLSLRRLKSLNED